MARPCKNRCIHRAPHFTYFKPSGIPMTELKEVTLALDELEAIRLSDAEGLTATTAAQQMAISRHTFGRILKRGRQTIALALLNGFAIQIEKEK